MNCGELPDAELCDSCGDRRNWDGCGAALVNARDASVRDLDEAVAHYLDADDAATRAFMNAFAGDASASAALNGLHWTSVRAWVQGSAKWGREWSKREYEMRVEKEKK